MKQGNCQCIREKSKKIIAQLLVFVLVVLMMPVPQVQASSAQTAAFFHDQGFDYISPLEPSAADGVILRFRTAAETGLTVRVKYFNSANSSWNTITMSYDYTDVTGTYYLWKGTIPASGSMKRYRFSITKNGVTHWYDAKGVHTTEPSTSARTYDFWIKPGFKTPDWSKGATWYSIMPDSFWNGDLKNDMSVGKARTFVGDPLYEMPWGNSHLGGTDWYGGDLKGLDSKISYLKNTLGINALFFNPVWDTYHNAGYGQDDYTTVNPAMGTNEDLKKLISTAHANNIKVMLDGVFQYHLDGGIWFNKYNYFPFQGAYQSQSSPYYPRFDFFQWPNNYRQSWNSPVLDFSNIDVRRDIYQNANSIMQMYLKNPYNADGWRLDVGNTFWGKTLDAHTILKDMRGYVKAAKSDALLLSEHVSGDRDLNDYTLDSTWNYYFNDALRAWIKQGKNQSTFENDLLNSTLKYPRPVALALYNFLTTHDYTRFFNEIGSDVDMMNIAQIVQMTFVGAPCIYFGDEYGEKGEDPTGAMKAAPNSFNSFNWDSSDWNYRIFNMYKTLSALRNQYSALRTGVYKKLITDNTNKIFAFARWDANGKIITITNQNTNTVNVTVSPREMSVPDGTVMTDWLSGRTFTVTGGQITVPVWAKSGAILVAGQTSGATRNEYETRDIGNVPAAGKTVMTDPGRLELYGAGNINGTSDAFQYAYSYGYDDFNTYARVDFLDFNNPNTRGSAMIRQSTAAGSKFYDVYVSQGGELGISYRTTTGATATKTALATVASWPVWILAQRHGNQFKAYYALDVNGAPGQWNLLPGSTVNIQMDKEVLQGVTAASTDSTARRVIFTAPSYIKFNTALYDGFENSVPSSMFTIINQDVSKYSMSNGKLNLSTNNTGSNIVVANAPFGKDWTAKVKVTFNPNVNGQEADLLAMQDVNNYVKVCRIRDNGVVKLGFGTVTGGYTQYNTLVNDPFAGSDVYLQLQRIGTRYSALYSNDGSNWVELGTTEHMNFSRTQVGIKAKSIDSSSATAGYDFFSFGNAINGEAVYNSGEIQTVCDTSFANVSNITSGGNWVLGPGSWSYTEGGFAQSSTTDAVAYMNYANKVFKDFYLETSVKMNSSGGWGGVSFRRSNYSGDYNSSGYLLYMTSNGVLTLFKTGTNLQQVSTGLNPQTTPVRLQVIAKGSNIKVFVNGSATPAIDVNDSTFASGYISLNTCLNAVEFKNTSMVSQGFNWTPVKGNWQEVSGGIRQMYYQTDETARWITLTGKNFRDVVVGADITFNNVMDNTKFAGIQLHADAGKPYTQSGILVYIKRNGNVGIMKNGSVVIERPSGVNTSSVVNMKVVVKGNDYRLFVNGSPDSILEYFNDEYPSGTVSLVTCQSDASFTNVSVAGMKGHYAANLAKGASVTTSSSIENYGFFRSYINDANSFTAWSSQGHTDGPLNNEWVCLDLGTNRTFNRVDLYPRADIPGGGFPVDFIIQTSTDNINWTDRVIRTNYPETGKYVQNFNMGTSVTARYVRVVGTKLRHVAGDAYRMQLSEIAVYNNDITSYDNFNSMGPWLPYKGTWNVDNGTLVQSNKAEWSAGAVLQGVKLANYTLEFKMQHQSGSTGWAGVLFRKTNWSDDHNASGYLMYVTSSGNIALFRNGANELQTASPGINATNWNTFKVVVNGSNIKVYVNGSSQPSLDVNDATYSFGCISLVSGASHVKFDDVKITPYF